MAPHDWPAVWTTWRDALSAKGAVIQMLDIDPPAREADVAAAEAKLGRPLPASLREVLLGFSSHVWFKWYLRDGPPEPRELEDLSRHGELEWSCSTLDRYRTESDDPADDVDMYGEAGAILLMETVVFQEVGNGDGLAVDFRGGEVVYVDHEGGPDNGVVLAPSFAEFVSRYSDIGCSGADWCVLQAVHADGGIDPDAPVAQEWRSWVGLPAMSGGR